MLRSLDVLVLDCQASGATPAHGDLLELGWAIGSATGLSTTTRAHWIRPRTDRAVPRAVRKLTGWTDDCLAVAIEAGEAWAQLREGAARASASASASADMTRPAGIPTVIHFARFEIPFLRALHAACAADGEPFPFDTVCLHAIAQRIFPDLPRRNLRALAGHLGFSPDLRRRAAGHVEATAFIWRALVPMLDERGARTWDDLKGWLEERAPAPARSRGGKRVFPLSADRRRALPDGPGVYRFLRPNGDVLYVGKAANVKKRVASHFTSGSRSTERALEMLSQTHDVEVEPAATTLEAALLETDEIKRLDPPYNVHLRTGDRHAWFASCDWRSAASSPDEEHRIGPLPSRGALSSIAAVRALLDGACAGEELRGAALGVPPRFAPEAALFAGAWHAFVREHLERPAMGPARTRILHAARRIIVQDSPDVEPGDPIEASAWDADAVFRYLERTVFNGGLLVQRARQLTLLADAVVAFREPGSAHARLLVIARGEIVERSDQEDVAVVASLHPASPPSRHARQCAFDAARYDRLRVLGTELRRIVDQGGAVGLRVGRHLRLSTSRAPTPRGGSRPSLPCPAGRSAS